MSEGQEHKRSRVNYNEQGGKEGGMDPNKFPRQEDNGRGGSGKGEVPMKDVSYWVKMVLGGDADIPVQEITRIPESCTNVARLLKYLRMDCEETKGRLGRIDPPDQLILCAPTEEEKGKLGKDPPEDQLPSRLGGMENIREKMFRGDRLLDSLGEVGQSGTCPLLVVDTSPGKPLHSPQKSQSHSGSETREFDLEAYIAFAREDPKLAPYVRESFDKTSVFAGPPQDFEFADKFVGRDQAIRDAVNTMFQFEDVTPRGRPHLLTNAPPGLGKTRFLHELCNISSEGLQALDIDPPAKQKYVDAAKVFISFNGATELQLVSSMTIEMEIVKRILFSFVFHDSKPRWSHFCFILNKFDMRSTAVSDIVEKILTSTGKKRFVLLVDEVIRAGFEQVLDVMAKTITEMKTFSWIGSSLLKKDLGEATKGSSRPLLWIDLPVLHELHDFTELLDSPSPELRRLFQECNNHPRAMEIARKVARKYQSLEFSSIRGKVVQAIQHLYRMHEHCRNYEEVVSCSLMGKALSWSELEDLALNGFVFNIRQTSNSIDAVPEMSPLWMLSLLAPESRLRQLLENLFTSEATDWYNFERFHALWETVKHSISSIDSAVSVYKVDGKLECAHSNFDEEKYKVDTSGVAARCVLLNDSCQPQREYPCGSRIVMHTGAAGIDSAVVYNHPKIVVGVQNKYSSPGATTKVFQKVVDVGLKNFIGDINTYPFYPGRDSRLMYVFACWRDVSLKIECPEDVLILSKENLMKLYGPSLRSLTTAVGEASVPQNERTS